MQLLLSPVISNENQIIKINGEKIQIDNYIYDFTNKPNGKLSNSIGYIVSAKRDDGELYVELINRLNNTAMNDDLYPKWQIVNRNDRLDTNLTIVKLDWYSNVDKELDALISSLNPTKDEIAKAERQSEMIELLIELEMI